MRQVRIEGGVIPNKVHLGKLQAAVDEAIGQSVPLMGKLDPETQRVLAIVVSLPDGVTESQVEAVLKTHAPVEDDREEVARVVAEGQDRASRIAYVLEKFADLERRLGALERGTRR